MAHATRRTLLLGGLFGGPLALGACSVMPPLSAGGTGAAFVLERDLAGRTYARGAFTNRLTGSRREFRVVLDGRWNGKTLTLREDFAYADGEKDVKTWVLTKTGPGRFKGTREDVVGEADVRIENGAAYLSYDVDMPLTSGVVRLHFEDVIERNGSGMIVNRAVVSKLGLPVGDVDLSFSRRRFP